MSGWLRSTLASGWIHVTPIDDLREHTLSLTCWCRPEHDDDEPRVIAHNSADRRELYETGELRPQ